MENILVDLIRINVYDKSPMHNFNQSHFQMRDASTKEIQIPPIYMFVVVNFEALAQASDIQIERRQAVFLC